ncbi:MAG: hypothetical protein Q4P08_03655, partial [Eubacteriales bacterium]|nr:hypothetical protein [Eubacteriales bacterium]
EPEPEPEPKPPVEAGKLVVKKKFKELPESNAEKEKIANETIFSLAYLGTAEDLATLEALGLKAEYKDVKLAKLKWNSDYSQAQVVFELAEEGVYELLEIKTHSDYKLDEKSRRFIYQAKPEAEGPNLIEIEVINERLLPQPSQSEKPCPTETTRVIKVKELRTLPLASAKANRVSLDCSKTTQIPATGETGTSYYWAALFSLLAASLFIFKRGI